MEQIDAHVPEPDSERGAWTAAAALGALGLAVLALALSGILGGSPSPSAAPPAVLAAAATPTPAPAPTTPGSATGPATASASALGSTAVAHRAIVGGAGGSSSTQARRDLAVHLDQTSVHIPERWMVGFYPIYATAQRTFAVNWLLIASIHRQESAFSTAPGIYRGLNFAGCCGGPMQFNVTNGPRTTWSLVADSYRYGARPAAYDHMTARHPSIYDDFDSIMAAAHLLSSDGAGLALDGSAWSAAYDYYGHDATGVAYADQVLARAISWSQHGFCVNCGVPQTMVQAVHAAYGAPVAASVEAAMPKGHTAVARRASTPRRPARSAHRPPGR